MVFTNKDALMHDYVPSRLPHRERELDDLKAYFNSVLRERFSLKIHVNGAVGTGKTVLCRRLLKFLEEEASRLGVRLRCAYVNLARNSKFYYAMSDLHAQVAGVHAAGLGPEEILVNVLEKIVREDSKLIVVLDEVDTYIDEGGATKMFYLLPRSYEVCSGAEARVSLIYVSRSFEWMKKLDAATLDTLGRTLAVKLQEYSMPQVKDIIAYRAEEAFNPGAVGEDVVDFIAYISKRYGGIRYALELLLEAGVIAERQGFSRVGVSEVRTAHAAIPKGVNGAFYPEELSVQKQVLLKSIMGTLDATSEPFVTLEDTQTNYTELCNHYTIEPEDEKTLLKYLGDLETEKYILLWKKGQEVKIGIEYPFHQLEEAINKSLEHELQRYKSAVVH
jgi:cell division control protein 6